MEVVINDHKLFERVLSALPAELAAELRAHSSLLAESPYVDANLIEELINQQIEADTIQQDDSQALGEKEWDLIVAILAEEALGLNYKEGGIGEAAFENTKEIIIELVEKRLAAVVNAVKIAGAEARTYLSLGQN